MWPRRTRHIESYISTINQQREILYEDGKSYHNDRRTSKISK